MPSHFDDDGDGAGFVVVDSRVAQQPSTVELRDMRCFNCSGSGCCKCCCVSSVLGKARLGKAHCESCNPKRQSHQQRHRQERKHHGLPRICLP